MQGKTVKPLGAPNSVDMALRESESILGLLNMVSKRVLETLPRLHRTARENGMRRPMYDAEMDRCLDWSVTVQDARLYIAEQLLAHISRLHCMLLVQLESATVSIPAHARALHGDRRTLASELSCALSQLQGMSLTHYPSKYLCSTKSAFELLLAIIDAPYTNQAEKGSPLHLVASHAVDTLMCTLVDASETTRSLFEQTKGLSLIRRVMNNHRKSQTDMDPTGEKCFEFLLFYLQSHVFEEQVGGQRHNGSEQPAKVFDSPATPSTRTRASAMPTPFYTPMVTPRAHVRVLSHGSPSKHPGNVRPPFGKLDTEPNPFSQETNKELRRHLRTRSTDERRHLRTRSTDLPIDLWKTPRATPRVTRDVSPGRRPHNATETHDPSRYLNSPHKGTEGLGVRTSHDPPPKDATHR
ncbi:hypothetical protein MPSI1_003068 [Malassezia psittaci]|uniref:Uncharacterized protein n=1 Tax=Malassezia psittaci TaxID=1821823 RepID=A0AAF0JF93_9BASI|nr:hypothetical protein MPSI1_003068 [Malassezia psittaci]